MKQQRVQAEAIHRPKTEFLHRFLGDNAVAAETKSSVVSTGISLHFADVLLCPSQDEPEEMAYLNFYPVADDNYYLQLSFLPEYNIKSGAPYRVAQLVFNPSFFTQWPHGLICRKQPFRFDRSAEQAFTLNPGCRESLDFLLKSSDEPVDFVHSLRRQEAAISLLRYALEAFLGSGRSE
jgi:hypothetical protein